MSVAIHLLADRPELIETVAELRRNEWGKPPEPTDPNWWLRTTTAEAGREGLPVTWVAVDHDERCVGAVGLGHFDIVARRDRSPWVLGLIIAPERRGRGIGRRLLGELERWAAANGHREVWAATSGEAIDFYCHCGWTEHEQGVETDWGTATILCTRPSPPALADR